MTEPHIIFDRALLARRRARAAAALNAGGFGADFLLREVAADFADRLAMIKRDFPIALDLGTHTGAVADTLAAAANIGAVIRADLCPDLVTGAPRPALACDEERLPFAPGALNLVTSALSLQWVNDLPGALAQIARGLAPDGLFLAALFGTETLRELRAALTLAETQLHGGASPRVAPFIELRDMGSLLQRAGLALPVADKDLIKVAYPTMFELLRDLRAMGATNVLVERARRPVTRRFFARAAEIYAERFARADGRIEATFEIVTATGWKPHESQQKPLAPGSARARLADALGTTEISTGEKAAPKTRRD
ncbi:MAG: methyltransferase domain-containing protein [Rhodobiaceae bacterium]|nr:methyltransferase domain-containing protein [Rhodobiaceae bacterium]